MVDAFTIIDLIAATTNAFVGALLARRPDHYRNYTRIGIVLLAIIGGIGGGVARDLILNDIPSAFTNPWYIILCTAAGIIALGLSYRGGQKLKEGTLRYMAAFSLPWYAAVGVNKALVTGLPEIAAIVIGIIGPTAGRFIIDTVSGITPKHFVKGEFFVGTALLASVVYLICYLAGLSIWPATLISLAVGFAFRLTAQNKHWEEKEPWEPKATAKSQKNSTG